MITKIYDKAMKRRRGMQVMGLSFIIYPLSIIFSAALLTACGSDDDEPVAKVKAESSGTWTDSRDGEQYGWVRYGGLDWMTDNFRYDIGDGANSTIYLDADENGSSNGGSNPGSTRNLARFGRLYTLAGAKAACPEGWRLPTDEDWQRLEQALGMSGGEASAEGWRGNIARSMLSIYDEQTDLNLLLGGFYNSNTLQVGWRMMGVFGYYWTSTADNGKDGEYYFVRKLTYNRNEVCRESMEPSSYKLSVRYVRE